MGCTPDELSRGLNGETRIPGGSIALLLRQTPPTTSDISDQIGIPINKFRKVIPVPVGIVATRPICVDGLIGAHPTPRHAVDHRAETFGM